RGWIKAALEPKSEAHQLYRIRNQNLDTDVADAAQYIGEGVDKAEAVFALTLMWEVLLSNHAWPQALRVSAALRKAREPFASRFWRWKDLFLWRLGIGVLAGFLLLSSSSLLQDILVAAQWQRGWLWGLPLISLVALFGHTVAYVLNHASGVGFFAALVRAAIVTIIGALYAAGGGLIVYRGSINLCMNAPKPVVVLSSAAALLLGFVFHMFWQDRSVGEPV
ncbi:MAG TPA: hypothetical protein VNW97_01980, partial [Candidatus Saccharimonadales bacterium]|nr:hypothetical protein [Candidatus Saccharimonadales bacterium]